MGTKDKRVKYSFLERTGFYKEYNITLTTEDGKRHQFQISHEWLQQLTDTAKVLEKGT